MTQIINMISVTAWTLFETETIHFYLLSSFKVSYTVRTMAKDQDQFRRSNGRGLSADIGDLEKAEDR